MFRIAYNVTLFSSIEIVYEAFCVVKMAKINARWFLVIKKNVLTFASNKLTIQNLYGYHIISAGLAHFRRIADTVFGRRIQRRKCCMLLVS